MPEITQAHILGQTERLKTLLDRMLRLTGYFSALAGVLFWVWGRPLAQLLYQSADAGFYLETLAPAMPLMYLESMVDGAMKGVGEQKAAFRYSVWDSILRIGGVVALLPRFGMKGFLAVILLSSLYTCAANTGHLLFSSGTQHAFRRWLGAPALAAVLAAAAGMALRKLLGGWVCGSAAFAAGRVGRRRLRYHRSVPAGGMAAGPWRGSSCALGCAPARQTEKIEGVWQRIRIFWTFCSVLSII